MAYNDRKILEVLSEELDKVPQRCDEYRKELKDLLVTVLFLEQDHAIRRTNVVKKIADRVHRVGMSLYRANSGSKD